MVEYIVMSIGRTSNLNTPYYEDEHTEKSFIGPKGENDARYFQQKLERCGYVTVIAIRR